MSMPRKIRCTVEAIADHGGRVYTVALVPEMPVPPFRPGQFLHLTVDPYDPAGFWPDSRVFSIASSPRERRSLRVCYAVKGVYTTRMEQALQVGSTVWVKLPYGDFVIDANADCVLLAGGTGISAFTAFIEALTPSLTASVTLVYGARSPDLFLFRNMLASQGARVPRLKTTLFSEASAEPPCHSGRISLEQVWPLILHPQSSVFYLSGPPDMLRALGAGLLARGVPPDRIRTDAWE
jgi:ferredoxin-NADP reductase